MSTQPLTPAPNVIVCFSRPKAAELMTNLKRHKLETAQIPGALKILAADEEVFLFNHSSPHNITYFDPFFFLLKFNNSTSRLFRFK